jgi:hypothetical protein
MLITQNSLTVKPDKVLNLPEKVANNFKTKVLKKSFFIIPAKKKVKPVFIFSLTKKYFGDFLAFIRIN